MIRLADAIEPGTLFSEMDENEPLPESSEPQPSLFRSEYKLWIAAALFAVGMIFEERLDALLTPFVAKAVFFGIPYLLCGLSVLKKGLQSLLKFDFFNEYTLMGGATIAAAAIGQLPEAVGVMLFYSIGEALQDRAAGNSRRSIPGAAGGRPTVAHLIEEKDGKQMVNDADPRGNQARYAHPCEARRKNPAGRNRSDRLLAGGYVPPDRRIRAGVRGRGQAGLRRDGQP